MIITRISLICIASAIMLLFTGCQSVNVVERAEPQAVPNPVDMRRIETDPGLARSVRVTGINESRSGDLLRIQVAVENLTYGYRSFNYQFVWFEADGMQVQSPSPIWRSAQVEGRDTLYLSGTAPNPRVVDFRLKLHDRLNLHQTTGTGSTRRGPR